MSSPDPRVLVPARGLRVAAAPCAWAGCIAAVLQPLYGSWRRGGDVAGPELQAIAVEPIGDRLGHYLGDDLIFDLNGTGAPADRDSSCHAE